MSVATYNVRTLAAKGKSGYGHDERVVAKDQQLGCDFIGLQETRRSGSMTCRAAECRVSAQVRKKTAAR